MIAYLKGIIDIKRQDYVVIDVHGVGYKIILKLIQKLKYILL